MSHLKCGKQTLELVQILSCSIAKATLSITFSAQEVILLSPVATQSVWTAHLHTMGFLLVVLSLLGQQMGRVGPQSRFFYNENTSYLLFSDTQQDGVHRIGWSKSSSGVHTAAWDVYAGDYLGLSGSSGGEIDQNVFYDPDTGKSFLLWKSDDNNVGDTVTRIWMSEISVTADGISVVSSPEVILDSTGLWWIDSWIDNGSLIEGPELIKPEGSSFYYLFFASGKYCQDSYAEGVARSQNLWGPYEKMGVPLLSTGAVGNGMANSNTDKLIGPGHGSLQNDLATGELYMMWHASVGHNCDRYPFTTRILFGEDEWPYAELV